MIITISDGQEIIPLKGNLEVRFEMKNLGELHHFLGLEFSRYEEGIFVSQENYAKGVLQEFRLTDCRSMSTPMEQNLKLKSGSGRELKDASFI